MAGLEADGMTMRICNLNVQRDHTDLVRQYDEHGGPAAGKYVWKPSLMSADLKAVAAYISAIADSPGPSHKVTIGRLILEIETEEETPAKEDFVTT